MTSPAEPAPADARPPYWAWLLLVAVGLCVLVPGTMNLPLLDRDEPRFSRATVEMEQRDTWVVPYFNAEYRFDKPPLTYWWMRLDYAVFGHNEFGARFHSIASAILIALVLLAMGRDFFGWKVHFWAGLAWLTLLQVWIHGRLAVADMPMVLCLLVAHWAAWRLLTDAAPRRWGRWFWALWGGLGVGFLAKGPVVLVSLPLTLVLLRWVFRRREKLPWGRLQFITGLPLCLAIIAAWGIPAQIQTHGEFWRIGMGKHVIDRGLEAFDDRRSIPVVFYLVTAFLSLFPWIGRLGAGLRAVDDGWDQRTGFLVAWITGIYLVFAFYATQLPHYVMPAFPAMVLLLMRRPKLDTAFSRRFYAGYHAVFLVLLFGLAAWLSFGPVFQPVRPFLLGAVAVLLGLQFAAMSWERRHTIGVGIGVAMVGIGSGMAGAGLQHIALSPVIAPIINDEQGTLAGVGYTEPSLVYYTGRTWHFFPGDEAGIERALLAAPDLLVVQRGRVDLNTLLGFDHRTSKTSDAAAIAAARLNDGWIVYHAEGLNIARFQWVYVDIYRKIPGTDLTPISRKGTKLALR